MSWTPPSHRSATEHVPLLGPIFDVSIEHTFPTIMAEIKQARVGSVIERNSRYSLVQFSMQDGPPLAFAGGQYIIVHTGLTSPEGKPVKRTYSLLPPVRGQTGFCLSIEPVPGGLASRFLAAMTVGQPLRFSGPWGLKPVPSPLSHALMIATDSGITGAYAMAARLHGQSPGAKLTLLRMGAAGARVPELRLLRSGLGDRTWIDVNIGEVNDPGRVGLACHALQSDQIDKLDYAYLAGDGSVVCALAALLRQRGLGEGQVAVDQYFNRRSLDDVRGRC